MSEIRDVADARARYEQKTANLVGRRLLGVKYWDAGLSSGKPRVWDYGDWHHAVEGLELITDRGIVSVTWSSTFGEFGIETFHEPIAGLLEAGPPNPEGWPVTDHPLWAACGDSPICGTMTWYEPGDRGPCPVAMRLDFDHGPIWIVAAQPAWPPSKPEDWVFVGGCEVVVVFSAQRMRQIGLVDVDLLAEGSSQ